MVVKALGGLLAQDFQGLCRLLPWDEEMEEAMLPVIEKYNEERT